ncbi:MAG: hypothetical protein HY584_02120 [Candidatus Omnitrophica bacterium]|nr:hypothetical protein [Candidatus Omnitrophota bacterium]
MAGVLFFGLAISTSALAGENNSVEYGHDDQGRPTTTTYLRRGSYSTRDRNTYYDMKTVRTYDPETGSLISEVHWDHDGTATEFGRDDRGRPTMTIHEGAVSPDYDKGTYNYSTTNTYKTVHTYDPKTGGMISNHFYSPDSTLRWEEAINPETGETVRTNYINPANGKPEVSTQSYTNYDVKEAAMRRQGEDTGNPLDVFEDKNSSSSSGLEEWFAERIDKSVERWLDQWKDFISGGSIGITKKDAQDAPAQPDQTGDSKPSDTPSTSPSTRPWDFLKEYDPRDVTPKPPSSEEANPPSGEEAKKRSGALLAPSKPSDTVKINVPSSHDLPFILQSADLIDSHSGSDVSPKPLFTDRLGSFDNSPASPKDSAPPADVSLDSPEQEMEIVDPEPLAPEGGADWNFLPEVDFSDPNNPYSLGRVNEPVPESVELEELGEVIMGFSGTEVHISIKGPDGVIRPFHDLESYRASLQPDLTAADARAEPLRQEMQAIQQQIRELEKHIHTISTQLGANPDPGLVGAGSGAVEALHYYKDRLDEARQKYEDARGKTDQLRGMYEQAGGKTESQKTQEKTEKRQKPSSPAASDSTQTIFPGDVLDEEKDPKRDGNQKRDRLPTGDGVEGGTFDSWFGKFDALQQGGLGALNATPTATLDAGPQSRDMSTGTNALTVDHPQESDGYKSGPQCE